MTSGDACLVIPQVGVSVERIAGEFVDFQGRKAGKVIGHSA